MATWFGHTQTISALSKSVTSVAGGVLNLESNVSAFMKKVIYYEQYFNRMSSHLPPEVTATAKQLFMQCFEYRDQLRDELESKLAYVADAGRWLIGMEDWNTKMERCLDQINELVLLANSLMIEFAVTGGIGASGNKEELVAYLQQIKGFNKSEKTSNESRVHASEINEGKRYRSTKHCQRATYNKQEEAEVDCDEDELNPFTTMEDGFGPLAASGDACTSDAVDFRKESEAQSDALSDFECLSRESIPEYVAFRKHTLRRKFNGIANEAISESLQMSLHSPTKSRDTMAGTDADKQIQQADIGITKELYTDSEREIAWNPFASKGQLQRNQVDFFENGDAPLITGVTDLDLNAESAPLRRNLKENPTQDQQL